MKINWKKLAPLGLYLALLALLVSIGLYIVQRQFTLALQICLVLIPIGLAVFALMDPERVRQALTGRQARYGSNTLVLSIAFIGLLAVITYLAIKNTKRWDLTEDKSYTLAEESLATLDSLENPVLAKAFFTSRMQPDAAKGLLDQYKVNGNGKFDYIFINPESDPVAAEQAKITRDGTIVLVMGDLQEPVISPSEQELTGGLVRLLNPEKRVVYFLAGHGEKNPEESGERGYSTLKRTLESKNYTVKTLNLLVENQIPDDAKVIVIGGPEKPLAKTEIDLLKAYQEKGGSIIALVEPTAVVDFGEGGDPLADYLAQTWGVRLSDDIIVDLNSNQPFVGVANEYGSSPITEKLNKIVSVFPTVRSTQLLTATIESVSPLLLVLTGSQSWAETDLEGLKKNPPEIVQNPDKDLIGPVPIAAQAENFTNKSRAIIFGDSDFASDANYLVYGNGDLIVNSIDWTAGQEELINLTPKERTTRTVVPPQSSAMNLILLATVIILPALALVGGIVVWIQRRRR